MALFGPGLLGADVLVSAYLTNARLVLNTFCMEAVNQTVKAPDWVFWVWLAAVVAFLVVSVVRSARLRHASLALES